MMCGPCIAAAAAIEGLDVVLLQHSVPNTRDAAAVLPHHAAASRGWSADMLLLLLLHAPHVCWQPVFDQLLILILVPAGAAMRQHRFSERTHAQEYCLQPLGC
jgi:hypothetical protein